MKSIKVLGTGCDNCTLLTETLMRKVKEMGLDASVDKVTDIQEIAVYGVMSVPAIVINKKVVHAGSVPNEAQIEDMLATMRDGADDECTDACECAPCLCDPCECGDE